MGEGNVFSLSVHRGRDLGVPQPLLFGPFRGEGTPASGPRFFPDGGYPNFWSLVLLGEGRVSQSRPPGPLQGGERELPLS